MRICLSLFLLAALPFLMLATPAHAALIDVQDHCVLAESTAASGVSTPIITSIVTCVKDAVHEATFVVLEALSDFMVPATAAIFTFATAIFGIRIMGGEQQPKIAAAAFLLRLTIIGAFSYGLAGFAPAIFDMYDELLSYVTPNQYDPWVEMDIILGRILGFAPGISLLSGMAGVLGGALFSSTVGMFLFGLGFMAILNMVFFVLRVLYTYLMAYITIAFLIAVSPIIMPIAVFKLQETYVEKWAQKIMTSMLMPFFLFAFLTLFLGIFHTMLDKLFVTMGSNKCYVISAGPAICSDKTRITAAQNMCPKTNNEPAVANPFAGSATSDVAFCGPDLRPYWKMNQPFASWQTPTDPAFSEKIKNTVCQNSDPVLQEECLKKKKQIPPVSSNIAPNQRGAAEMVSASFPGIDFGPNNVSILQDLSYTFVTLFIFATLMTSFLQVIHEVANSVGKGGLNFGMQGSGLESTVKGMMQSGPGQMDGMKDKMKQTQTDMKDGKISKTGALVEAYRNSGMLGR